jgi:hypothetical protein
MPNGRMENKVPAAIPSRLNFVFRSVATEPSVINVIPKRNIPAQAAIKTKMFFFISHYLF